jgi:hypothetical protein
MPSVASVCRVRPTPSTRPPCDPAAASASEVHVHSCTRRVRCGRADGQIVARVPQTGSAVTGIALVSGAMGGAADSAVTAVVSLHDKHQLTTLQVPRLQASAVPAAADKSAVTAVPAAAAAAAPAPAPKG